MANPFDDPPATPAPKASSTPSGGLGALSHFDLAKTIKTAERTKLRGFREHVVGPAFWAAKNPLEALGDVLDAPGRLVRGAAAEGDRSHDVGRTIKHAFGAAFNPGEGDADTEDVERLTHANALKVAHPKGFLDNLRNGAVDFGVNTLTNPLTYVGLPENQAAKVFGAVNKMLPALVRGSPELTAAFTDEGAAIARGAVNRVSEETQQQAAKDAALAKDIRKTVHEGGKPRIDAATVARLKESGIPAKDLNWSNLPRALAKSRLKEQNEGIRTAVKAAAEKDPSIVRDPKLVDAFLKQLGQPEEISKLGQIMQGISDAGKDAIFMNSLPHMLNVSTLAYLAGGPKAVIRGLAHAFHPDASLLQRLEAGGGTSHFTHSGTAFMDTIPGVGKYLKGFRDWSQGMLDKVDTGMRASRLEQLDKSAKNLSEPMKMERVRQDIGDYENRSPLVKSMQSFGGYFPQWRMYVIPTTFGRALVRNPGRVGNLVRAETTTNDQLKKAGVPYDVVAGKPQDDFAKLLGDYPSAFTGHGAMPYMYAPSTIGPLAEAIGAGYRFARGDDAPGEGVQDIMNLGAQFVPFGSTIEQAAGLSDYSSKAPGSVRAPLSLVGSYTKNRETRYGKMIDRIMVRDGVNENEAKKRLTQMLRAAGVQL